MKYRVRMIVAWGAAALSLAGAAAQTSGNVPGAIVPSLAVGSTHTCAQYYPAQSQRRGESGTVQIGYDVETDGTLTHVKVLQSSGHDRLDQAAAHCVSKSWRNRPALYGGIPIRSPGHMANIRFVIDAPSPILATVMPPSPAPAAPSAAAPTTTAEDLDTGDSDALDFVLRYGGALAIVTLIVMGLRRWVFRAKTCPSCAAPNRGLVPFLPPAYCSSCGTKFERPAAAAV